MDLHAGLARIVQTMCLEPKKSHRIALCFIQRDSPARRSTIGAQNLDG